MADIENYMDLRVAVADEIKRRDMSHKMDKWTRTAESKLNKRIRCYPQIQVNTLTFVDGVTAAPLNFQEEIEWHDSHPSSVVPTEFSTVTQFYYPDFASQTKILEFYAKLSSVASSDTTTNWLLIESPETYLYSVALEASIELKNVDDVTIYSGLRESAIDNLYRFNYRGKHGLSKVKFTGAHL